jgi:hypothetical protein
MHLNKIGRNCEEQLIQSNLQILIRQNITLLSMLVQRYILESEGPGDSSYSLCFNRTKLRLQSLRSRVAFTPSVLSQAELSNQNETTSYFKLYNTSIHTWSKVQLGHVITLKAGDHIFLKGHNVTHCPDFDRLFRGQLRAPHFSNNLQHERAHVRQAMKER